MHCFTGDPEQAQQALDLGFLPEFLRRGDVPEGDRRSRVGKDCSARPNAGGDGCSVSGAGAVSRQTQRTVLCSAHGANESRNWGERPGIRRRGDDSETSNADCIHLTEVADAELSHSFSARRYSLRRRRGSPGSPIRSKTRVRFRGTRIRGLFRERLRSQSRPPTKVAGHRRRTEGFRGQEAEKRKD